MKLTRCLALLVAIVLTVAGCTGVPGSSGPQVVKTVGLGEAPAPSVAPPPNGADPRTIVQGFLDTLQANPDRLDAAKAYLDPDAALRWTGSTVTVIQNNYAIGNFEPDQGNSVKLSYQAVGAVAANGTYTPQTVGQGYATTSQVATYSLAKNAQGQWRIRNPVPTDIYITLSQFTRLYTPKSLYFLDAAGTKLVPDLRYSALAEPALETFLLGQLAQTPDDLGGAVTAFQPTQAGNQRLSVTPGTPTVVQVPGAAALDGAARTRLAAQLAYTLRPAASFQSDLQIQDGKQVVTVPDVGDSFDFTDFTEFAPFDDTESTSATYLRGGAVVDATGKVVTGALGTTQFGLDSAVFDGDGGRTLVAGTTDATTGSGRQLLVGDASGLTDVRVPAGDLTAPVWAPIGSTADTDEVWVGSGSQIYRYVPGGPTNSLPTVVPTSGPPLSGTVVSLAFSPEGSRLALVIANGVTSQVFTAPVIRSPDVSLGPLRPVTPLAYRITDVGWTGETQLAAVGSASGVPSGVYLEFAVDGSRLTLGSTDGLPGRPSTLAVSPRTDVAWVSVISGSDSSVWSKASSSRSWVPATGAGTSSGYAPSFST